MSDKVRDINLAGYVPVRRGLLTHLQTRRMTANEYIVFTVLLMLADHETGTGLINASAIVYWTGGQISLDAADRALRELDKKDYIVREIRHGKHELYPFRVQNFEIFWRDKTGAELVRRTRFDRKTNKTETIDELLQIFGATAAEVGAEHGAVRSAAHGAVGAADNTTIDKEQRTTNTDSPEASSAFRLPRVPSPSLSGLSIAKPRSLGSTPKSRSSSAAAPGAANLTQIFRDKTGHWKFKQKTSAAECETAFSKLLLEHTEDEIADVIDYAATHPMYATGMRTVSIKADPWDWFVQRYDEIHAHMLDDADYIKRVAQSVARKKKAIESGVKAGAAEANRDPLWGEKNLADGGTQSVIKRKPKTKEERVELLTHWQGNPRASDEYYANFLVQPACPKCKGQDLYCDCVTTEEVI